VITNAHNFEGWTNFPKERERLYALLEKKGANNAILLTGDRHAGGFYKRAVSGNGRVQWEMTSSSLNFAFGKGDNAEREPDPMRTGGLWAIPNFGLIDVDWDAKRVRMSLRKEDGSVIEEQVLSPFD
jgi:alkaline phosphatase D